MAPAAALGGGLSRYWRREAQVGQRQTADGHGAASQEGTPRNAHGRVLLFWRLGHGAGRLNWCPACSAALPEALEEPRQRGAVGAVAVTRVVMLEVLAKIGLFFEGWDWTYPFLSKANPWAGK